MSALLLVTACGGVTEREDDYNKDKQRNSRYEYGSAVSEKGGWVLFGDRDDARQKAMTSGIGVNGFLWRAALDTVSFMPIASADPFGGTIITDWYAPPSAPNERIKMNIFVLSRELRADGVRVAVFRQVRDVGNNWTDATVTAATAGSVEDGILTRARQMRIKQVEAERKN